MRIRKKKIKQQKKEEEEKQERVSRSRRTKKEGENEKWKYNNRCEVEGIHRNKEVSSKGILRLWCFVGEGCIRVGCREKMVNIPNSTEWTRKCNLKKKKMLLGLQLLHTQTNTHFKSVQRFETWVIRTSYCWSNQNLNHALSTVIAFTKREKEKEKKRENWLL